VILPGMQDELKTILSRMKLGCATPKEEITRLRRPAEIPMFSGKIAAPIVLFRNRSPPAPLSNCSCFCARGCAPAASAPHGDTNRAALFAYYP
jgi:hypothetical protein